MEIHTDWWVHDRFGMIIHWGLYSLGGRHEWIKNYEAMTDEQYQKYYDFFNPTKFDPSIWAKAAKAAGMKYVVIVTKHHDGFCLFDSKYTDYKSTNTAAKRDLIKDIVEAFRKEGIRIGFYYSLLDWHHPDYTIDACHPKSKLMSREAAAELNKKCNFKNYTEYLHNQVRELLTNYGTIDILWFDYSYPNAWNGKGHNDWESERLVKMIRSINPNIILGDRLDYPVSADFFSPEQYTPDEPRVDEKGNPVLWEGGHTFAWSWGYYRDEYTWKSPKQCIDLLINNVCRGGNLIMNIGPESTGALDERALAGLKVYADWMNHHSASIYGCGIAPAEFPEPRDCRYTYNAREKKLYLHFMNWPYRHVHLKNMEGRVKYAQLMIDGSEIKIRGRQDEVHTNLNSATPQGAITLELPVIKPNTEVPVIELFLK